MGAVNHALLVTTMVAMGLLLGGCATADDGRTAAQQIEDTVTISRVRTALLGSDHVDGTRIEVDVVRGHVQLEGAVASETERAEATRLAEAVEGVRSVENNLALEPTG
jgi:hyperosmotically inducible periplasmic protein